MKVSGGMPTVTQKDDGRFNEDPQGVNASVSTDQLPQAAALPFSMWIHRVNCTSILSGLRKTSDRGLAIERANIGYVKLDLFADPQICAATASAVMTLSVRRDALILDTI